MSIEIDAALDTCAYGERKWNILEQQYYQIVC